MRAGDAAQARGEVEQAQQLYENLLSKGRSLGDVQAQTVAHQRLGDNLAQRGLFHQAVNHMLQGLSIARTLQDRRPLADLLNTFSYLHWRKGDLGMAFEYNAQLRSLASELGDEVRMADAQVMFGNVLYSQGMLRRAADAYTEAKTLFTRHRVPDQVGRCLVNLSSVHYELGDLTMGLDYARQCLEHCSLIGDRTNEGYGFLHGGECLAALGRTDEALSWARKAESLLAGQGDHQAELDVALALATVYRARGELVGAKLILQKAEDKADGLGVLNHLVLIHNALGKVLLEQGDLRGASRQFEEGLLCAEEIGRKDLLAQMSKALDEVRARQSGAASPSPQGAA